MKIREVLQEAIKETLSKLGLLNLDVTLEYPADESHGDYSTNIALVVAKKVGKSPMELAEEIKRLVGQRLASSYIEKIEVLKPGFINFWLSEKYLTGELEEIVGKEDFGSSDRLKNKKIMLEFADPNPFKEFHIGHLRNITLGESFARLLESQGATVWRVNYQGDVGMHVAKSLYGFLLNSKVKTQKSKLNEKSLREKVKLLGECYAIGNKAYEEDEEAKKEIQELNKKIYAQDSSVIALWQAGRRWSLEYFETIYRRVGTVYKRYYPESEVAQPGRKIVLDHIEDGIFDRHEGAVVFRGEKEGLHTRVFVTKEDYATYEAKDMALAIVKYKDFPYDRSIIITAHEQAPYFTVVLAAMKQVFPDLASKTTHFSFGFVRLKDTKMSSRLGNIITGQWLLDEAKARITKEFPEMDQETAEKVAVGAVKYSMLKFSPQADIKFSFEESISLEGNSGPYVQYTFARTRSVLAKAHKSNLTNLTNLTNLQGEELMLLRLLHRFPEIIEEAGDKFAPNLLCNYLFELAQSFNLFYQKHPILTGKNRVFRLTLTEAVGLILKNGLFLLGIAAPQRM